MNTYGCFNRAPYKDQVQSQQFGVTYPFVMSKDCNYTHTELGQNDPRCQGCKHKAEKK